MKYLIWMLCSSTYFSVVFANTCKIHTKVENTGYGTFDCEFNNCWINIDPVPSQGIELQITSYDEQVYVKVFTTFSTDNKTVETTLKGEYSTSVTYFAGLNEGFLIQRNTESCIGGYLSEYKFTRVGPDRLVCDPVVNYIGHKIKVIQRKNLRGSGDICPYHLLPSEKPHSSSETIYLLSRDGVLLHARINGIETNERTGRVISYENWASVDFQNNYFDYSYSELPQLMAVSTDRSCDCMNTLFIPGSVTDYSRCLLQSPGYPDFLCPFTSCNNVISFKNTSTTGDYVERKLVSLRFKSLTGVSLQLKSEKMNIELNENSFSAIDTSFLVDDSNLEVSYKTPKVLYLGTEGQFTLDVNQIKILKDCTCSIFNQKQISNDYSVKIRIPYHCELFFCDWTIKPSAEGKSREMNIFFTDADIGDEVQIWNKQITEIYKVKKLQHPRKLYLTETSADTHLFLWRKSKGINSTFNVNWKDVDSTICDGGNEHYFLSTTPLAITSSNYPMPYTSGICKILLEAPKYHIVSLHITDFNVENYHDEMNIYDGNSTESKSIGHLTGEHTNLVYFSTGNFILLDFIADDQHTERGFHFVAKADPNLELLSQTEMPEPVADNEFTSVPTTAVFLDYSNNTELNSTFEMDLSTANSLTVNNNSITESSTLSTVETKQEYKIIHLFSAIFIVIGVVTTSLAVILIVNRKVQKTKTQDSFVNALVRFRNADDDSIATIET